MGGIYSSKSINVRVIKDTAKFCNKHYMKTNLPIKFNRGKYNFTYKSHIYHDINFYKYPSKSRHKILKLSTLVPEVFISNAIKQISAKIRKNTLNLDNFTHILK